MRLERIHEGTVGIPIWFGELPQGEAPHQPPAGLSETIAFDLNMFECEFRGIGIDRLQTVLDSGIDVMPTEAPMYASDFEKAWEYGDIPKVVLALDRRVMQRTWREMPADTPEEVLAPLRALYPAVFESKDGQSLWLTRLPVSDSRAATVGETAYGWWIPGDPWQALRAIFVFGPADMTTSLLDLLRSIESP